jgi:hypothetical protein
MNLCLKKVYVDCFFLNVLLLKPNVGQNKLRAAFARRRGAPAAPSAGAVSPAAALRVETPGPPASATPSRPLYAGGRSRDA